MKPALLVATTGWDVESWARRIRAAAPRARRFSATDRERRLRRADEALAGVHYVLAWKPLQETLDRLPGLRVDLLARRRRRPHLRAAAAAGRAGRAHRRPDLTARMTEYVVWQVLHHLRRGAAYRRQQAEHVWHELDQPRGAARHGRHHGLRRHGRGRRRGAAARSASRCAAGRASPKDAPGVEIFHGAERARRLPRRHRHPRVAAAADAGDARADRPRRCCGSFAATARSAAPVFINAGRGGSQVEADIVEALRDGTLAGASLDVFETEPLAGGQPALGLRERRRSRRMSRRSPTRRRSPARSPAQIDAFERGEPLRNRVDPARGY